MKNFWKMLNKPFFVLAPMDGVTDFVFRQVVAEAAKPDVLFTEFTNVEGLNSKGKEKSLERLKFNRNEHPIVAQIWGIDPEDYFKSAKLIQELGFDGIDINMGCPDRSVIKKGVCSALINNQPLAKKIIKATKAGAPNLPISVKTRIGFNKIQTKEWLGFLLKQNLAVITVHGRTVREMSRVPAHWDEIGKVVELRNTLKKDTLILGNGDVSSVQDGLEKSQAFGVDGVMVGTGIFHDFWMFDKKRKEGNVTKKEKISQAKRHLELFNKIWGESKRYDILKKYFKIYINGFEGANELRIKLMETHSSEQAKAMLK